MPSFFSGICLQLSQSAHMADRAGKAPAPIEGGHTPSLVNPSTYGESSVPNG